MSTFGFLVYPDLEEMDLVGPWEVISIWGKQFGGPDKIITIAQSEGLLRCIKGLTIVPDYTFENAPALDYFLVPGGQGSRREVSNEILIDFIRDKAKESEVVLSVCTGALLLEKADLLKGKKATTHWNSKDRLKQCEEVTVLDERFVRDGNVWTSAGISAGVDMALVFVAETAGKETAGQVQHYMEYYPDTEIYADESDWPLYVKSK